VVLRLRKQRELTILGFGLALLAAAVYADHRDDTPAFSPTAAGYTGRDINPIDRLGYTERDERAGQLADAGLYGGPTLPLLLSLHLRPRQNYPALLLVWLETMLLTFALTSLIKNTVSRPRPYVYNDDWQPDRPLARKDRAAFLSGHAANATAGATLFAGLLAAYGLDRTKFGRLLAGTVAGTTAFLRVKAGKHWPTDALAGILLGGGVAGAMLWGHRR
jgi:membrane-associated phospholipid phosphatase